MALHIVIFAIIVLLSVDLVSIHAQSNAVQETVKSFWAPDCSSATGKIPRLIPHPSNCRSIFVCAFGTPKEYFCPRGEIFNAEHQECKKEATCRRENSKEQPAFERCPKDEKINHLYPHPTDCSMFYQCVHGVAMPRPCPRNLHFNPKLKICDWPDNANCKARFFKLEP